MTSTGTTPHLLGRLGRLLLVLGIVCCALGAAAVTGLSGW
jgi:hypothetical protein